jgi:uncharacterized sodium:solute symporter family permease YidK
MHALDWLVIGLYFGVIAFVVWWTSRKQETSADYFLAGRNIGWFVIGASLFASNIGSEHLVGLAGLSRPRWNWTSPMVRMCRPSQRRSIHGEETEAVDGG